MTGKLRKKNRIHIRRAVLLLLCLSLIAGSAGAFFALPVSASEAVQAAEKVDEADEPVGYEELKGKQIGVQTGTICDELLPQHVEDVKIVYYDSIADLHNALLSSKVDAITTDEPTLRYMAATDPEVVYRKNVYEPMEYASIFNKTGGKELCDQYNAFLAEIKEDGTLDEMRREWFDEANAEREIPDYRSFPATNGTIHFACDAQTMPFAFARDDAYAGYEIELTARFCEKYGYALEVMNMQFGGIVPAVSSGRCEIGASCITITEERAKSVLFSDPTYSGGTTIGVRKGSFRKASDTPKIADYANKRIAVLTGSNFPDLVSAELPNAEQLYFNTYADAIMAVKSNKADAIATDDPVARNMAAEDKEIVPADGYLRSFDYAYAFPKTKEGQQLCDEISAFIKEKKKDGTLEAWQKKWFDDIPEESMMETDPSTLTGTNRTIRVATLQCPPFVIQGENSYYGFDAELLAAFAKENGYGLEIAEMNGDAIIPAVQSGKCDLAAALIAITEERKEEMLFSEPEYTGGVTLAVKKETFGIASIFASIRSSFEKTFIREGRYLLFLQGIATTLLISALSALFGTILGFLIFLACRRGNRIANFLARIFRWFMAGMPVVVLLMILYYIVFGKVSIDGAWVSIIGFTLIFGAEVLSLMTAAVDTVDRGQMEAAYALGYTDRKGFFRHILPQAMPHFMPGYRGGLISLIKSTSIVGYVAVQDLTKMGDIVRSRTYEAFFPLIAVAIFYFILAGVLVLVVNLIMKRFERKQRRKDDILKGIRIDDRAGTS